MIPLHPRHPSIALPPRALAAGLLALTLLAGVPGCTILGVAANALEGNKVKAVFKLPDQPTLVLVDDPDGQLGDPALPGVIASHASFLLSKEKAVTQVIDPGVIAKLRHQYGDAFPRMPVDRIGREAGARQVIHIAVANAAILGEPGMVRPVADVFVRVTDVVNQKRLFPLSEAFVPNDEGQPVRSTLRVRAASDRQFQITPELRQKLAERVGRDVSRLFYEHTKDQPGEAFTD